ncbi:MAG: O-antigen ligase family protein [bacterium]
MANQKISKIFFYIFVFLLPWQTRLILFPEKPEFLGFSIYLSEIFLWLALTFWLASIGFKKIKPPFVFMFLCFYVLVSIFWSPDKIAAFRIWLYIFEGMMVYLYLKNYKKENPPQPSFFKGGSIPLCKRGIEGDFILIFLFSLFIASVFGIFQFFNLGSPAWKWLGLAERGAWNLGDIVVQLNGARFLRAYGPFPHPNIFGGYLAAGILLLFRIFPERSKAACPAKLLVIQERSGESRGYNKNFVLRLAQGIKFLFGGVFFLALFLTFSRSAWLALAAASTYFIFKNLRKDVLKFFVFLSALAIAFYIIFLPLVKMRIIAEGRLEQKSNTERVASWKEGFAAWRQNPFFGSGPGNYNVGLAKPYSQPAHNIFILVLAELGIAGFVIYLFLWRGFWKNPVLRPFLILFFVIGLFDHYLWTLYSGSMLFWFGLSLFSNENS